MQTILNHICLTDLRALLCSATAGGYTMTSTTIITLKQIDEMVSFFQQLGYRFYRQYYTLTRYAVEWKEFQQPAFQKSKSRFFFLCRQSHCRCLAVGALSRLEWTSNFNQYRRRGTQLDNICFFDERSNIHTFDTPTHIPTVTGSENIKSEINCNHTLGKNLSNTFVLNCNWASILQLIYYRPP